MVSLSQGFFDAVTVIFVLVTLLFFAIASLFLANKKKRIIQDCLRLKFPLDGESLKDTKIGRLI